MSLAHLTRLCTTRMAHPWFIVTPTDGNDVFVSWCFEPSRLHRSRSGLGSDDEVFLSSLTNYDETLF